MEFVPHIEADVTSNNKDISHDLQSYEIVCDGKSYKNNLKRRVDEIEKSSENKNSLAERVRDEVEIFIVKRKKIVDDVIEKHFGFDVKLDSNIFCSSGEGEIKASDESLNPNCDSRNLNSNTMVMEQPVLNMEIEYEDTIYLRETLLGDHSGTKKENIFIKSMEKEKFAYDSVNIKNEENIDQVEGIYTDPTKRHIEKLLTPSSIENWSGELEITQLNNIVELVDIKEDTFVVNGDIMNDDVREKKHGDIKQQNKSFFYKSEGEKLKDGNEQIIGNPDLINDSLNKTKGFHKPMDCFAKQTKNNIQEEGSNETSFNDVGSNTSVKTSSPPNMQKCFDKRLLSHIRKYSNIYDTEHKLYSDTAVLNKTWLEIAQKMRSDVKICRNRYNELRNKYELYLHQLRNQFKRPTPDLANVEDFHLDSELLCLFKFLFDSGKSTIPQGLSNKGREKYAMSPQTVTKNKSMHSTECEEKSTTNEDHEDDDLIVIENKPELIVIEDDVHPQPFEEYKITHEMRKLVELVKLYPELYDIKNPQYNDYGRKSCAWNAIADSLGEKVPKVMKLWLLMITRFEWEISRKRLKKYAGTYHLTELQILLFPFRSLLMLNPNSVYKQSFYLKEAWYAPMDSFRDTNAFIRRMKQIPDIIFVTDLLLYKNKKNKKFFELWYEMARIGGRSAGQCETTWLIMRALYLDLTKMRQSQIPFNDKWYFEPYIEKLYAISEKNHQNPKHASKISKNKSKKIQIQCSSKTLDNLGNDEMVVKQTPFIESLKPSNEDEEMKPIKNPWNTKICPSTELDIKDPSKMLNQNNGNENDGVLGLNITKEPIAISQQNLNYTNSGIASRKSPESPSCKAKKIKIDDSQTNEGGCRHYGVLDSTKLPDCTSIPLPSLNITKPPIQCTKNNFGKQTQITTNSHRQFQSVNELKELSKSSQHSITVHPLLQGAITKSIQNSENTLHVPSKSPSSMNPLSNQSLSPNLQAEPLMPKIISAVSLAPKISVSSGPGPNNSLIIKRTASTSITKNPCPLVVNVQPTDLPFPLPKQTKISAIIMPPSPVASNPPIPASPLYLIPNTNTIVSGNGKTINLPPSITITPAKANPAKDTMVESIKPMISIHATFTNVSSNNDGIISPRLEAPTPITTNESESVSRSSNIKIFMKGGILFIKIAFATKKCLLPRSVEMFIREVLAIPLLHNKHQFHDGDDSPWLHISKKFGLPIQICQACWDFLRDKFYQIISLKELLKPYDESTYTWNESYELFREFDQFAVTCGWHAYISILPDVIQCIGTSPNLYKDVAKDVVLDSPNENQISDVLSMISTKFSKIENLNAIWISLKNIFCKYMTDLELGIDHKWNINWWRVLAEMQFLVKMRYSLRDPFYYIVTHKIQKEIKRCAKLDGK
ncbi:uncharacterized protein LOC142230442 [Haematobia irritans]|uniref:uncharacterized protein LOC142230442 n=1 Tax=Haematobia irritans TaxID=7368 RepID=UPI003F501C04